LIVSQLNVEVEWLALLLYIREIPDSNLGLKTGYPKFSEIFLSPNAGIISYIK
jgi:hypothetical protein